MKIFGKYEKDNNFITVYTEDTLYTITRNTGDWGYRKVGDELAVGGILTQAVFDSWKSRCQKEGVFALSE